MSQELFIKNIEYLVEKNIAVKKTDEENAVMRQTIANALAELNHQLSDEDIIFVYSLKEDKEELEPDNPDNKVTTLKYERIGIFLKNDIFIEVLYMIKLNSAAIAEISKRYITGLMPIYKNVGSPDRTVNDFEEIDHLIFKMNDLNEGIKLYSHQHSGNKSIKEIYLEFLNRLK